MYPAKREQQKALLASVHTPHSIRVPALRLCIAHRVIWIVLSGQAMAEKSFPAWRVENGAGTDIHQIASRSIYPQCSMAFPARAMPPVTLKALMHDCLSHYTSSCSTDNLSTRDRPTRPASFCNVGMI
jgi:hypothetical protein